MSPWIRFDGGELGNDTYEGPGAYDVPLKRGASDAAAEGAVAVTGKDLGTGGVTLLRKFLAQRWEVFLCPETK